jgi:hypothetical protein
MAGSTSPPASLSTRAAPHDPREGLWAGAGSALNTIVAKEFDLRGAFRFHEEFGIAVDLLNQGLVDGDLLSRKVREHRLRGIGCGCAAVVSPGGGAACLTPRGETSRRRW